MTGSLRELPPCTGHCEMELDGTSMHHPVIADKADQRAVAISAAVELVRFFARPNPSLGYFYSIQTGYTGYSHEIYTFY